MEKDFFLKYIVGVFTLTVLYWLEKIQKSLNNIKQNKTKTWLRSKVLTWFYRKKVLPYHSKYTIYMQQFGDVASKAGISLKCQCSVCTCEDLAKRSGE